MPVAKTQNRFAWLATALGARRGRMADLRRSLIGLGRPGAMKPALFTKFLHLLDQVAVEREKEIRLLNRIEAMEDKHHQRRRRRQLKKARPVSRKTPRHMQECEDETPPPRHSLLWFLTLGYLFGDCEINQK